MILIRKFYGVGQITNDEDKFCIDTTLQAMACLGFKETHVFNCLAK